MIQTANKVKPAGSIIVFIKGRLTLVAVDGLVIAIFRIEIILGPDGYHRDKYEVEGNLL